MKVRPRRLRFKLRRYGVPVKYVPEWDSRRIDPYNGNSDFHGIMLHHTAGTNSLRWICYNNRYAPVRAAHFLIARDGTVHVCSGVGAYHAGAGGPWRFPGRPPVTIPRNGGNSRLFGIEIESLGRTPNIDGTPGGMTIQQVVSTALLSAALLNAMRRGAKSLPVSRVIRHRDWTTRKIDTLQELEWWHQVIGIARRNRRRKAKTIAEVREFVRKHPRGRL